MSLTAIPAYFLARRLLPSGLSLVAAALTVLVPSMLYTGMLMTENAFYPLFVLAAFLFVRMLEAPTWRRQVVLLAVCFVAFETRAQAVALIPAIVVAPVLLALIERRPLRKALRPFATLYAILGGGALLAVLGHRRDGPLAAQPARRLPRGDHEQLHGRRLPALPPLPRRRVQPLCRRHPVRGAARALARPAELDARRPRLRRRLASRSPCSSPSRSRCSPPRPRSTGSRSGTSSTSRPSR